MQILPTYQDHKLWMQAGSDYQVVAACVFYWLLYMSTMLMFEFFGPKTAVTGY